MVEEQNAGVVGEGSLGLRLENDVLSLQIVGDDTLAFSPDQVDGILAALVDIRRQMSPPVPRTHDQSKSFKTDLDGWFVDQGLMNGQPFVHVRHPGLGWMHLGLSKEDALKMARWLIEFGEAQPEAPPAVKN